MSLEVIKSSPFDHPDLQFEIEEGRAIKIYVPLSWIKDHRGKWIHMLEQIIFGRWMTTVKIDPGFGHEKHGRLEIPLWVMLANGG